VRQAKKPKAYRFGPKTLEALDFLLANIDKTETAIVQDCIQDAADRLMFKLDKSKRRKGKAKEEQQDSEW
jgi:hypothetical protein